MQAKWYIEKEFFWEGQPDTILSVLDKMGISYYLQKSRLREKEYAYDMFPSNDCVLVYGSIEFVRKIHRESPWTPGASWVSMKNLLCSTYYAYYGKYLLNQEYCFVPLSELKRRKEFYFKTFGENNKLFVRPDSPYKEFTGFVADLDTFDSKIITMSYGELEPTLMVLIAKPQEIIGEYRFYLCKDEVVTGSQYKLNGEHDEAKGYSGNALLLAQEISKVDWRPSPIFVADIGIINGKNGEEAKLLEINSFNCSGMYYCDLEKIVAKANKKAIEEWEGVYIDTL